MKYIKKYKNTEYNVGDIVRMSYIDEYDMMNFVNSRPGEIVEIDDSQFPYRIDFIDMIPNGKNSTFIFSENEILRKATDEEIELFNLKKETNKYNI